MLNVEWYESDICDLFMSIGKNRIGLSKKLFDDMDQPEYVQLGYLDKGKRIIMRPCDINSEYGIKVKSGKYPPKINNKGFIEFLINKGFEVKEKTIKYKAIWDKEEEVYYIN